MSRYEHTDTKKHSNQSYGGKDTTTERSTYKIISFMCFNYIKTYIRYFIDNIN